MKKRNLLVWSVCAMMGAIGFTGCGDDGSSNKKPVGDAVIRVAPAALEFLDADEGSEEVTATYLNSDAVGVAGKTITVESGKPACAKATLDSKVTDDNGKAVFDIRPSGELAACRTKIKFKSDGATTGEVRVTVGDGGNDSFDNKSIEITDPASGNLKLENGGPSKKIIALYTDPEGNAGDVDVNYTISDPSCISLMLSQGTTNSSGVVENTVTAKGDLCTSTVTVSLASDNTVSAVVNVSVSPSTQYLLNIKPILDTNKYDRIAQVGYYLSDQEKTLVFEEDDPRNHTSDFAGLVPSLGDRPVLANFKNKAIPKYLAGGEPAGYQSVVVIGLDDKEPAHVIAYGVETISEEMDGETVEVQMNTLPYKIEGTYTVVSNFDFTSGFQKSADYENLYVERYLAGDWVQFVMDLFKDPVGTLFNFAWVNTLMRLRDLASSESWISGFINFITGPSVKTGAKLAATNVLNDYLGNNTQWYGILTSILPAINDLVGNMQFMGQITIPASTGGDMYKITGGQETFNKLLYLWPLPEGPSCIDASEHPEAYIKQGDCRVSASLGVNSINGTWNGSFGEDAYYDGVLNIESHNLTFQWVSILYRIVFGEILPRALGYSDYSELTQCTVPGSTTECLYMKAFLIKILFQPFVQHYLENNPGMELSYQSDKPCEQFVEALINMAANSQPGEDTSAWLTFAKGVGADIACNQGIALLDEWIINSLNKIAGSTNQMASLSSMSCPLYSEDNENYTKIGKGDDPIKSVNELVPIDHNEAIISNRCNWNLDFSIGTNQVTVKGLHHGERTN